MRLIRKAGAKAPASALPEEADDDQNDADDDFQDFAEEFFRLHVYLLGYQDFECSLESDSPLKRFGYGWTFGCNFVSSCWA
jgi:hypothetical protein